MGGSAAGTAARLARMPGRGEVISIHLRPRSKLVGAPVPSARVEAGRGLVGDRYHAPGGAAEGEALTLIEQEALEALRADTGIALSHADSRRQVLTRGLRLNELVGREFSIGDVRCLGVELCEPCVHLQSLTRPGVLDGLVHRGGLRCDVLSDGEIAVGSPIG